MSNPLLRLAVGVLLLSAAPLAVAAPDNPETTFVDVSDLVADRVSHFHDDPGFILFRAPATYEQSVEMDMDSGWADRSLSASELSNMLSVFATEADPEWGNVSESGGQIQIWGSAEAQRRVKGAIEILRRSIGGSIRVDVESYRLPAGTDVPTHPDAATLQAFRAVDPDGGAQMMEFAVDGDRWHTAKSVRSVGVLADVDVEIAQEAQIGDPIVHSVEDGLRVLLRAAALSDGRATVRLMAATGELTLPVRRLSLGPEELGSLELPEIEAAFVSTEVLLEAGRPLALSVQRPSGEVRALVLHLRAAAHTAVGGAFRLLPTAALSPRDGWVSVTMGPGPQFGEGPWLGLASVETDIARFEAEVPAEIVSNLLESEIDEGTCVVDGIDWLMGPGLMLRGPAAQLDRAAAAIAELERTVVRHARLDVRLEERGVDGSTREVGRLALTTPLGIPICAAAYRQISYVMDNDVEVAQTARIADPIVGVATAGTFMNASVAAAGDGRYVVLLELRASDISAPEPVISGAKHCSVMERVRAQSVSTNSRVMVPAGGAGEITLGRSPFSVTPRRLVAVVRVTD